MEGIGKIIALILGLITVVIIFAVLTGRVGIRNLPFFGARQTQTTPTPAPTGPARVTVNITRTTTTAPAQQTLPTTVALRATTVTKTPPQASTIPAAGSPTILLVGASGLLLTGIYLRRK